MLIRSSLLRTSTRTAAPSPRLCPSSRPFINLAPASATHQKLHARRVLPYKPAQLYAVIADVESYPLFLPYCTSAQVLTRTPSDAHASAGYPRTAELSVGWNTFRETFTSRVFCVPGVLIEAISGEGHTSVARERLPTLYTDSDFANDGAAGEIFRSLRTKWEFSDKGDGAEVELNIEALWNNALLATMSQQAAPLVADRLVEAFEGRAKVVLG